MGGLPNSPDAKKAIKALQEDFGWTYDDEVGKSSHACGFIDCGEGCRWSVYRTGADTARALWRRARKCPHGRKPTRLSW